MSRFLNYRDIDFTLNEDLFYANTISISADASVSPIILSDGSLVDYAPDGALVGSLSCDFYLTGSLPDYLNVTGVDESAVTGQFASVKIENMYLKGLSFSLEPMNLIVLSADFDWYGDIDVSLITSQAIAKRNNKQAPRYIAHAHKTEIKRTNVFYAEGERNPNLGLINNLSYSSSCDRPAFFRVGEKAPFRVGKLNKVVNVDLQSSDLGDLMDINGKKVSTSIDIKDFYSTDDGSSSSSINLDSLQVSGLTILVAGANLDYEAGQIIRVKYDDDNYFDGTITAYDAPSGALTVSVSSISGSGTYASWDIVFIGEDMFSFAVSGVLTKHSYDVSENGYLIKTANITQTVTEKKELV